MLFATADLALLCAFIAVVVFFFPTVLLLGRWVLRLPGRAYDGLASMYGTLRDWNTERKLRAETLKQERLRTSLLEEQLRNEQVRTFLTELRKKDEDK